MLINIKATRIGLTPELKDYIQKKMDMVEKYLGEIPVIKAGFKIERTTRRHTKGDIYLAQASLFLAGETLLVEKTEEDLYKAVDKVKDHLHRSIKRYKEKMIDKKRKSAA